MSDELEYWFNVRTKQVEHGRQSHFTDLIGPYATREEAELALETAKSRNEAWEEEDERWEDKD